MRFIDKEEDLQVLEVVKNKPGLLYSDYAKMLNWPARKTIGRLSYLAHRGILRGRTIYTRPSRWHYKTRYYINQKYVDRVSKEAELFKELGLL